MSNDSAWNLFQGCGYPNRYIEWLQNVAEKVAVRILLLTQFYPPTIGGEEQHVYSLSHALTARGHEVTVVTLWREGLATEEVDHAVRIYRIPSLVRRAKWLFQDVERRHAPPLPDPEALWALHKIMDKEQPEVVHAHNWLVHSFLPLKHFPLKQWGSAKLVVTLHDYSLVCATKRMMHVATPCSGPQWAKCLGCASEHYGVPKGIGTVMANGLMGSVERRVVDFFVTVSQTVAVGNGLVGSDLPYAVLPNFLEDEVLLDPTTLRCNRPDWMQESLEPYLAQLPKTDFLLFVGDLVYEKGITVLLRAYGELKDAPPLVLIGRILPEMHLNLPANVMLLGRWPHAAVMQAWRRATLALAPSLWPEPFGLVALEAMACGCPVIASNTGGLAEIVMNGETGILVPPNDVVALRQALERLLADAALRQRMGWAGRDRAATYRASVVIPQLEQIYHALLTSQPYSLYQEAAKNPVYNRQVT